LKDIVVLAPIKDVYDKAVDIIEVQGYENIAIVEGTMSEGLQIAKDLEKRGVKIIVTRGGTYKLLKSELSIPIVEIKVSAYDIIHSFTMLESGLSTLNQTIFLRVFLLNSTGVW